MTAWRGGYIGLMAIALLVLAFFANLLVGSSTIHWVDAWTGLMETIKSRPLNDQQDLALTIVGGLRLPRAVLAMCCGGALAVAGVISQGLFRNSLADASVLGTSAGASFGAVLLFYFGVAYWHWLSLPAAAFAGAALTIGLVLMIPRQRQAAIHIETLLLLGFALNSFLGALSSLIISLVLEDQQKAAAVLHWLLGGLIGKGPEHLQMLLGPCVTGGIGAWWLARRLDVLSLGEDVAENLGVHTARLRLVAILTLGLLVGGAVSVAGALPFIGLIVPHLTRRLWGPTHKRLLIWSGINGMSLLLLADLMARTVRAPAEIEVGVITALLGAPFFAYLLLVGRRDLV